MIYVRSVQDDERTELKRMTRQEVGRVARRAQIILLSADRRAVPEIARIFDLSRATVRFWIERFNAAGPAGLYDEPRSGRPRKVTERVKRELRDLLRDDPAHAGHLATCWTVAMLILAVMRRLSLTLSPTTLRRTLLELGLRWGRPRLAMPTKVDAQKAHKQWLIAQALLAAGPEAALLYADESRIQLLPLVRAMWHWVGEQVRIPTPGTNESRTVFGALNVHTGQWTYLIREHLLTDDFLAFLEHVWGAYPSGPIILVVDNFSSHTAKAVKLWLAAHQRLQLFYLPTYCSHLNPVERIWLQMKNQIAANRLANSMDTLLGTVGRFFDQMSATQALAWTGA